MWVTDNLRSRQSFVALAAMACRLDMKLGTAVTVQYFRNPVDLADSITTLSELMDGRELSIGLGRGNPRTPSLIRTPRPVSVLRETPQSVRRLLDGEEVCFADYPNLLDYYHFNPSAYRLSAYGREGAAALAHGNRGRKPRNAVADDAANAVVQLASATCAGAKHTHFTELLRDREGIDLSQPTV